MGLPLWACSVWRWGAFDGPSPSRNAGSVCMVTGDLHTRTSNTSVEHAPRETRGTSTMQLTDASDGRDRLNACNYDRPRKGPIAIARSAARRGADRTARARCVCKSQQHVHFLPGQSHERRSASASLSHVGQRYSRERENPRRRRRVAAPRAQARSALLRCGLKKNFASNFSVVSLDSNGTRHARSVIHLPLFTLPQHTRRELETTPGHKTQQPPSPGILQWDCTCGPVLSGDGEPSMARRPAGTPAECAW